MDGLLVRITTLPSCLANLTCYVDLEYEQHQLTIQEVDWLSLHPHPITISIQLPAMPDKPEWRLDGSVIPLDGLMVNSTFGDMRERIKRALNVELPISRLQITYEGKVMANAATLASVNLGEGDLVGLGVKGVKKK